MRIAGTFFVQIQTSDTKQMFVAPGTFQIYANDLSSRALPPHTVDSIVLQSPVNFITIYYLLLE
jgi:hypothetical protein